MILTCPNCGTRFALDPARLGSQGRTVRCARCLHTWFAEAPADQIAENPARNLAKDPDRNPFDHLVEQVAALKAAAEPVPEGPDRFAERPIRPDRSRITDTETRNLPALLNNGRLGTLLGWGGLALFVALVVGGVVLFARDITGAWPAARKLYDSLGLDANRSLLAASPARGVDNLPIEKRLKLIDLAPSQRFINGTLTLVINGKIQSISPREENLPPIEVVLLDNQKLDLKTWVFEAPQKSLKPGVILPFETRLENPPPAAQDIRVTFSTSKQPASKSGGKTG